MNRRLAALAGLVVLLCLMLAGLTYMLASLLQPPGADRSAKSNGGVTMTWVRSIYASGPGPHAQLQSPVNVDVSPAGEIYLPDPTRRRILVFDSAGDFSRSVTSDKAFKLPNAVAFGPRGLLFVADKAKQTVMAIDAKGTLLWEKKELGVNDLLWTEERLYVAAFNSIAAYDAEGSLLFRFGERGYEAGQFDFPHGLVRSGEMLLVADGNNARVQAFDLDGKHRWTFGESPLDPKNTGEDSTLKLAGGLTLAQQGKLIVMDPFRMEAIVFSSARKLIGRIGEDGQEDGDFIFPTDIAHIDGTRYVIADTENHRLQIVEITFGGADTLLQKARATVNSAWCVLPLVLLLIALVVVASAAGRRRSAVAGEVGSTEEDEPAAVSE